MSTPVVPNEGENAWLTIIKAGVTWRLGLFQNNATPSATTVLSDLTAATFSGYSVATPSYGSISTNGSGQAEMTATQIDFDHNGGATSNTIYGYYVYDNATSKLIKAEKFDSSVSMANNGDRISVTDKMLLAGTIT